MSLTLRRRNVEANSNPTSLGDFKDGLFVLISTISMRRRTYVSTITHFPGFLND